MRREHKSTSGFAFSRKFAKRAREFHSSRSARQRQPHFSSAERVKGKTPFHRFSRVEKVRLARLARKLQRRFPRSPSGLASTGKSATLLTLAREIAVLSGRPGISRAGMQKSPAKQKKETRGVPRVLLARTSATVLSIPARILISPLGRN